MTATQLAKAKRATPEYKTWKRSVIAAMRILKANGQDASVLATCPDSYSFYLKLKF